MQVDSGTNDHREFACEFEISYGFVVENYQRTRLT